MRPYATECNHIAQYAKFNYCGLSLKTEMFSHLDCPFSYFDHVFPHLNNVFLHLDYDFSHLDHVDTVSVKSTKERYGGRLPE